MVSLKLFEDMINRDIPKIYGMTFVRVSPEMQSKLYRWGVIRRTSKGCVVRIADINRGKLRYAVKEGQ